MATTHQSNPKCLLILFCCYCFILSEKVWVEATRRNFLNPESPEPTIVSNLYRTSYHFQPPHNWINDPNGPMYYKGIYHLFYQYNPKAAVWGNITWGHSVSTDMINWTPVDLAINPTKPFDINGCWSGSATIVPSLNKPVILYTGSNQEKKQVQNIAFPKNLSDPYLKEWMKPDKYNPVMSPVGDINPTQFRDPTTGWKGSDGYWRVALGAEIGGVGMALLYKSKDFVEWVRAEKPLYSPRGSGMWECPDFYPVALEGRRGLETSVNSGEVKHVLKMSLGETHSDHYMLGRYDEKKDVFIQDNEEKSYRYWRRYDYGNFYASKTFYDAGKGRRILWGWSNESDSTADDVAKGWAGIQTIPRMVWLDENGRQLVQWPIEELESLRRERVHFHDKELKAGGLLNIKGVKASQVDVNVEFELPSLEKAEPFDSALELDPQVLCEKENFSTQSGIGPFGLLVMTSLSKAEVTAIYFKIFKTHDKYVVLMCSDQRRSSLRPELYLPTYGGFVDIDIEKERRISLRTLVDHSVVESFGGGGRTCMTARVYPAFLVTSKAYLHAFNNGSETVSILDLNAWNLAKPRINVAQDQFLI